MAESSSHVGAVKILLFFSLRGNFLSIQTIKYAREYCARNKDIFRVAKTFYAIVVGISI